MDMSNDIARELPDEAHIRPYLEADAPWTILFFPALASSNQTLMEMALHHAPSGRVVTTGEQHAGRGRLGRIWHSPPNTNLYLSALLRPTLEPSQAALLSFAAALAAAEALEALGVPAAIKWPNDIVLGEKHLKIGGILSEMRADRDRLDFVVIGIGLNLNMHLNDFPIELRGHATSVIAFTGKPLSRARVAAEFLSGLQKRTEQLIAGKRSRMLDAWRRRTITLGKDVEVDLGLKRLHGRAVEVDDEGTLWLLEAKGQRHAIRCGDVRLVEKY